MDIYDLRRELNNGRSIYELNLRVTFYARVSTGKDEQAHSLSNQISYYTDFIEKNPNWEYVDGYVDEALSGTSVTKRESFLRMISDAELDKFDLIITKEISRFSRNTLDSIKYTQDLLRAGVGVLFQSDNINTLMPDSELRLTIMSSIAQDEVRKLSERVRFGFKRSIENGVVLGNSRIWGYTKENGKLVIDEKEAAIVKRIFELYAVDRLGIRRICDVLTAEGAVNHAGNPFSFSTLKNILTNPKYKGYYCGGKTQKYDYRSNDRKLFEESQWVTYKDEENVPPIVSEELWERANQILAARSEKQRGENNASYNNKYTYSGKVICGKHQTPYYRTIFRYKSGNKEAWQCSLYSQKGTAACDAPVVYTSELDSIVRECYDTLIKNRAEIIHEMITMYETIGTESSLKMDLAKMEVEINSILSKKDKLLDLSIKGILSDSEFESRNNQFNQALRNLEEKMKQTRIELEKNKSVADDIAALREIISSELNFDEGFSSSIIELLLDRVEVYKTDDKKVVNLKVYFKPQKTAKLYQIRRSRGTSVCSELSI